MIGTSRRRLGVALAAMALAETAGRATAPATSAPPRKRYYDPGSNPRPVANRLPSPAAPKVPATTTDHARLAAAAAKRARKAEKRRTEQKIHV
ncbi:hypothetical protein [Gemmatimonas sp.]